MGQILIRNLDDAIIAALRRRAAEQALSLEEAARRALAEAVGRGREEALARLDALRARIGRVPGPSVVEILRQERDRRSDRDVASDDADR